MMMTTTTENLMMQMLALAKKIVKRYDEDKDYTALAKQYYAREDMLKTLLELSTEDCDEWLGFSWNDTVNKLETLLR